MDGYARQAGRKAADRSAFCLDQRRGARRTRLVVSRIRVMGMSDSRVGRCTAQGSLLNGLRHGILFAAPFVVVDVGYLARWRSCYESRTRPEFGARNDRG